MTIFYSLSPEYTVQGLLDIGKTVIKVKRGIVTLGKITSYNPNNADLTSVLTDPTHVLTDPTHVLTDSTHVLTDPTVTDIDVEKVSTADDSSFVDGFAVRSNECAVHPTTEIIPTTPSAVFRMEEDSSDSTAMGTQEHSTSAFSSVSVSISIFEMKRGETSEISIEERS